MQEPVHGRAPELGDFLDAARSWLDQRMPRRSNDRRWGQGSDEVAIFRNETPAAEAARTRRARAWQREKYDGGYGALDWPAEYGGAGLPRSFAIAFAALEAEYDVPPGVDGLGISLDLEAATILEVGTAAQRTRWIPALRRADELCCQLFSEPGAGSDLGGIALRAEPDGADWLLTGQKVWSSGAQYATLGLAIARTDPRAPNTAAFTAFVVPMDAEGMQVRPLRQLTGGASFNEVFFDRVRIANTDRLGAVGAGWAVMMTTLGFERARAASTMGLNRSQLVDRLVDTARHRGIAAEPEVRARLGALLVQNRLRLWLDDALAVRVANGDAPGAEGCFSKLAWTRELQVVADAATLIVGPGMAADQGAWGSFSWSEMVLGVPGMRLGGGTDEIQKNTIAERVLGLPREPRRTETGDRS